MRKSHVSRNQRHAAALAEAISRGGVEPAALSDADWHLLLLAAGVNCHCATPLAVADRVLRHVAGHTGYFAGYVAHRKAAAMPAASGGGAGRDPAGHGGPVPPPNGRPGRSERGPPVRVNS